MQGLLLINKPKGMTSFSVCSAVRRLTGEKKVGHTGTLDPMATGVLPVLIGSAAKLSDYMLTSDKEYIAEILLGTETDTYDITGNVISTAKVEVSENEVIKVINSFVGEGYQIPPIYSAIKKDGKKMYDLARKGETAEISPRKVVISEIEILSKLRQNKISFRVKCSKGTYIRSLCHDIGEKLGCFATLSELKRTYTASFSISECIDLACLTKENIKKYILPSETVAENLPQVNLSKKQAIRFSNGGEISLDRVKNSDINGLCRVKDGDVFLGLGFANREKNELTVKCNVNPILPKKKNAVALGTFDGVHNGHIAVLKEIKKDIYIPNVICFRVPPKFSKEGIILTNEGEKTEILRHCGIENIEMLDFDEVKDITATEFLNIIKEKYSPALISCGYNYRFGKGGEGDTDTLIEFCEKNDIKYKICDRVSIKKTTVSSTAIREFLKNGEVKKARLFLGRNYSFKAKVIHGDERGRTIGFPTVNQLYPESKAELKFGVYKTKVTVGENSYFGMTNIGIRPTFLSDKVIAETYIFDFSGDLYGSQVTIELLDFIREEKKFASLSQLKENLIKDMEITKGKV